MLCNYPSQVSESTRRTLWTNPFNGAKALGIAHVRAVEHRVHFDVHELATVGELGRERREELRFELVDDALRGRDGQRARAHRQNR